MHKYLSFLGLVFAFWACTDEADQSTNETKGHPLAGQWATLNFPIEASLQINEDSTFHVDLMISSGIEIQGITELNPDNRITFMNTVGSDSVASNPYPGVYEYSLLGDTVRFTRIDDTISRRQFLLSASWLRQ